MQSVEMKTKRTDNVAVYFDVCACSKWLQGKLCHLDSSKKTKNGQWLTDCCVDGLLSLSRRTGCYENIRYRPNNAQKGKAASDDNIADTRRAEEARQSSAPSSICPNTSTESQ